MTISRRRLDRMTYDELEQLGLDDCGRPLEGHPPLERPLAWQHGRPCSRSTVDLGRRWDGGPAPQHTPGEIARWASVNGNGAQ